MAFRGPPLLQSHYSLNLHKAEFKVVNDFQDFTVSHQIIAHRKFTGLIMNIIRAETKEEPTENTLDIDVFLDAGSDSDDITNTGIQVINDLGRVGHRIRFTVIPVGQHKKVIRINWKNLKI